MTHLPELPIVQRRAVRLVVLDLDGRALLFCVREPMYPELGLAWELPGGGIDDGETYVRTAIRELREEAGLRVTPGDIAPPSWRRRVTFRHGAVRRVQDEIVARVQLTESRPAVDVSGQDPDERDAVEGFRWWSIPEIERSSELFYPSRLPALIRPFLAGHQIDEPFERFS